jgi:hypothetical protein
MDVNVEQGGPFRGVCHAEAGLFAGFSKSGGRSSLPFVDMTSRLDPDPKFEMSMEDRASLSDNES